MAKSRIAYLDKIKGISILLVVFCHSVMLSAGGVLGNIVMCVAWGAVPCFFMVTGALLNNAQKFDWKKYFARFFKAYAVLAVWKIIYLLVTCTYAKVDISLSKLFEYVFLFGNLDGVKTGAMWFMTAYLLVLLFYPLTWHLMHGGKGAEAALMIAAAIALFGGILLNSLNLCSELLTDLFGRKFPDFSNVESILPLGNYKNMLFYFIAGGFVMNKKDKIEAFFAEKDFRRIYPAAAFFIGTLGLMLIKKYYAGTFEWAGVYVKNGYGRLSTVFVAFGIYFGSALYLKKFKMPVVSLLGRSTLGIYYLHYMLLSVISYFEIVPVQYYSLLANVAKTIVVTAVCLCISLLLKKIPVLKNLVE